MGDSDTKKNWFDLQFHDENHQQIKKPHEIKNFILSKDYSNLSIDDKIFNRIKGSLFGLTIGDALGAHVEFRPREYLKAHPVADLQGGGTWGLDKGQFTDDTSMALCLANSLIACQDFNPYDQLIRYKWWYRHGYMSSTGHCFDIGTATRQSIQEFELRQKNAAQKCGISIEEMDRLNNEEYLQLFDVNCSKEGVAGNGALMRLSPVPLFFYQIPEKAVLYSGLSARITHGDKKAIDACRYYAALIVAALQGKTKEELLDKDFHLKYQRWFGNDKLHQDIINIAEGSFKRRGGYDDGIRGKGYVVQALEAALWAFWNDEDKFDKGVLDAINLGDDTDTTAAIYGQLAGAFYGFDNLPGKWREAIYAKEFILHICNCLSFESELWYRNQNSLVNSNPVYRNDSFTSIKNRLSKMNSLEQNPLDEIERKVIDPNGSIGDCYNAYNDTIIKSNENYISLIKEEKQNIKDCFIKRGYEIEFQNLLEFLKFDNELRLSLLSGLSSSSGISSIINYPYLIDENTRLFYYSLITKQTQIDEKELKSIQSSLSTHFIRKIQYGIEIAILFRLKTKQIDIIDQILNNLCQCLTNDTKFTNKSSTDQIPYFAIYSNIPFLTEQKTIIDIYNSIKEIQQRSDIYWPMVYFLHPIKQFSTSKNNPHKNFYNPIQIKICQIIEQYFFRLLFGKRMLTTIIGGKTSDLLEKYLPEQLNEQKSILQSIENEFNKEKNEIQNLIIHIRQTNNYEKMNQFKILSEENQIKLKRIIDDLLFHLSSLKTKADFIYQLETWGFKYINAKQFSFEQGDNDESIEKKLIKDKYQRIICSNDYLNERNWNQLNDLLKEINEKKKQDNHLNLFYFDFSYSTFELNQIKIFPIYISTFNHDNIPKTPKIKINQLTIQDETINILLLGKIKSGKSTLINTFGDYIKSKTRQDHQINVIISFLHLIGNEFDGHAIQIGSHDLNENYDCADQSVTQQCKSYCFILENGQKICIIDTPGLGDRRGEKQDDITMQHILSYINNLTHINAICFIIDSNNKDLSEYGIYLKQLLHYFEENIIENIFFCFTKSLQSNLGDTKKHVLLKSVVDSILTKNRSFNSNNILSFDSSYFIQSVTERYWVKLTQQNQLNEQSLLMTKDSWQKLLNYFKTNSIKPYFIHQGLQKAEFVRLELKQIIRPIFETIRNFIRNQILYQYSGVTSSIVLRSKSLGPNFATCYSCHRQSKQYGQFWILSDSLHHFSDKCQSCSCSSKDHFPITYYLEYYYSNNPSIYHPNEISNFIESLLSKSALLSVYLLDINEPTGGEDLFLTYLEHMINDELWINHNKAFNRFNSKLYDQLVIAKHLYVQYIQKNLRKRERNDLEFIQNLLNRVKTYPLISEQLQASTQISSIQ